MGYILKNNSALLTTKMTDAARKKLAQGNFNISYFQIGDSEVCYDCIEGQDYTKLNILDSEYNSQTLSPIPEKNKANIKYPIKVSNGSSNTFGIPIDTSYVDNIYNTATDRGFFSGNDFKNVNTDQNHTINPNYIINLSLLVGNYTISANRSEISVDANRTVKIGDIVTIYFGNYGSVQPIDTNLILTYKVKNINGDTSTTSTISITLDRKLPNFNGLGITGYGRLVFYPSSMTDLYDSETPEYYWETDAINFESNCDISVTDVKIWNMNIPWTESPAGIFNSTHKGYNDFSSKTYVGTKEYLGYNSNSGQTDSSSVYYYNSFDEKITVSPKNQKAIAIVHYTNNSIDNFYGEKFALESYDSSNPGETGQARNFKIHLPWLMWHKSSNNDIGETFYVDPPGYENLNLFTVQKIESTVNSNMNNPGLRYYHLWDINTNDNGYPNRVGKVWPDLKVITFDDDEIVASLSYKSNRNWTLPAPKLGLIVPNTFNGGSPSSNGLLSGTTESLWVTYRFDSDYFTESLHCNYYTLISGTDPDCPPDTADVTFRIGNEFPFMNGGNNNGFSANDMIILAQKVTTGELPDPTQWKKIDVTSQMSDTLVDGFITPSGITNTTFVINKNDYTSASTYNLSDYIDIPTQGATEEILGFGDEYYFYGTIETDIQATIYVMNYLCNLGQNQFNDSTNPTWNNSIKPYVTEVGLYDNEKNLMIITKVQSPEKRNGVQQYSIKLDF